MTPNAEGRIIRGMRRRRQDRGGAGIWLLILILVVGIFAGYRIGRLYFDKATIENEVGEIGDRALTSPGVDVGREVSRLMASYDVELDPEKVQVKRSDKNDRIRVDFDYQQKADLLVMQPVLAFSVSVEREGGKAAGLIQHVQESVEDSYNDSARKYQKAVEDSQK